VKQTTERHSHRTTATIVTLHILIFYLKAGGRKTKHSETFSSRHGLDDRAIEVRSPAGANNFSSSLCPDRLWGPPSLLYNGHRVGPFPGGKEPPGRDADHSPPSTAEVVNEQELYLLSPLRLHRCVVRQLLYGGRHSANINERKNFCGFRAWSSDLYARNNTQMDTYAPFTFNIELIQFTEKGLA
jgi:hypothetical protein